MVLGLALGMLRVCLSSFAWVPVYVDLTRGPDSIKACLVTDPFPFLSMKAFRFSRHSSHSVDGRDRSLKLKVDEWIGTILGTDCFRCGHPKSIYSETYCTSSLCLRKVSNKLTIRINVMIEWSF